MKTPEEMAREFANDDWGEQEWGAYCGFLAGYKAAMEEEATRDKRIAELWAASIKKMLPSVHEITLFPSKLKEDK